MTVWCRMSMVREGLTIENGGVVMIVENIAQEASLAVKLRLETAS